MECAGYKASIGLVDPRDIEPRFRAFETVALERRQRRKTGASDLTAVPVAGGRR